MRKNVFFLIVSLFSFYLSAQEIPFCTYALTYRDETLAKIAELTPRAKHLKGYGTTSSDSASVRRWLLEIGLAKQKREKTES